MYSYYHAIMEATLTQYHAQVDAQTHPQGVLMDRYREAYGFQYKVDMRSMFSAGLCIPVNRMTWRSWEQGTRPSKRILLEAIRVYPANDWRNQLASELMGARAEGGAV